MPFILSLKPVAEFGRKRGSRNRRRRFRREDGLRRSVRKGRVAESAGRGALLGAKRVGVPIMIGGALGGAYLGGRMGRVIGPMRGLSPGTGAVAGGIGGAAAGAVRTARDYMPAAMLGGAIGGAYMANRNKSKRRRRRR